MSFDTIKLEKGMYNIPGKTFTQVLESLDSSENYQNTDLSGLDAFQRQLKRFGIKVSGAGSDSVEKFFATTESAALFPEYISRAVMQGIEEADQLSNIVATKTVIDGMDNRTSTSDFTAAVDNAAAVAEAAALPETNIRLQSNLVGMSKHGRLLSASYESLRFQKLDLFTVTLKQIGKHIARAQFEDAVKVLINGDGNGNAAPTSTTAASGTVTYTDLVTFWNKFSPFALNTIIASPAMLEKLLNITEFKNPLTGLNFAGDGKLSTPLGANLVRASGLAANSMVGIDKNCALEMVQAGTVNMDCDKLIDRQLERAAISTITGFAKIFPDAAKVLNLKA